MATRVDGLEPPRVREPSSRRQRPVNRRRAFWLGIGTILTIVALLVWGLSVWFTPNLGWSDRLSLLKLAQPGRYLVLFQNPRELRSTGGLLGSFAAIETGWFGVVRTVTVETNIYKRQPPATDVNVPPPPLMADFIPNRPWPMVESNWALDARTAATSVATFYEATSGQALDGVIFTDIRLLERLLRATGPITVPGHQEVFSSETVYGLLQTEVEKDYFTDSENQLMNEPKTIIAEFLPVLAKRLLAVNPNRLMTALQAAMREKELMAVLWDTDLAATLTKLNWDGHLRGEDSDYLYINESAFATIEPNDQKHGAKWAWSIERTAGLEIAADGLHSLRLHRRHVGSGVWPDGPGNGFLRIVLPAGSQVVEIQRFDDSIIAESVTAVDEGRTVVGLWSALSPGQTDDLLIRYRPPTGLKPDLIIQRQPGVPAYPIVVTVDGQERYSGRLEHDIELR